jgi:S1-C subfamily serine protease
MKSCILVLCITFYSFQSFAVYFGTIDYYRPESFIKKIQENSGHDSYKFVNKLQNAINATVFLPKRGTGVLISPDGIIATAAHVISHLHIGASDSCPGLNFYLNHEINSREVFDKHIKLICEEVLVYDYAHDFALVKVKIEDPNATLPFVEIFKETEAIRLGSKIITVGHPHARSWNKSSKVISVGPIIFNGYDDPNFPHLLHLADTQGGHSGSPLFNVKGELVGIHFRGIPYFSDGIEWVNNGEVEIIKTFNVAIDIGFIYETYLQHYL